MQIRQSARSTQFQATRSLVANHSEANFLIASHDDFAAIMQTTGDGDAFARLAPHQQLRLNAFMVGFLLQIDFAYQQYLGGQLEKTAWKRMEDDIPIFLNIPGLARWWEKDKQRFTPAFVDFVERKLAASEPPEDFPTLGDGQTDSEGA